MGRALGARLGIAVAVLLVAGSMARGLRVAGVGPPAAQITSSSAPPQSDSEGRHRISLRLLDDRGQAIKEPVEVCAQRGLVSVCERFEGALGVTVAPEFEALRIEGPAHGPLQIARAALSFKPGGAAEIKVPRKARLTIQGSSLSGLTASLYALDSPGFRDPEIRWRVGPGDAAIPAGDHLISFSRPGNAPDLQRLSAPPGATVHLLYHQRAGWSLVVRSVAAASRRPLAGVRVAVAEALGYGKPDRPRGEAATARDGLVIFDGLESAMVRVTVNREGFVQAQVNGLTASPGTFAFRPVEMHGGGRLLARVSQHGKPIEGTGCKLVAADTRGRSGTASKRGTEETERALWQGKVGENGVCLSPALPGGLYKLRVVGLPGGSRVNRWVTLLEDQTLEEDVALAPARVTGSILRAGHAAPGFSVTAVLLDSATPAGALSDSSATTPAGEDGSYGLTVWSPGWYSFVVKSPRGGATAARKELTLAGDEQRTLDFDLQGAAFRGRVMDRQGNPIADATVLLKHDGYTTAHTDPQGAYELDVEADGHFELSAARQGYRASESRALEVATGAEIPPVDFVLARADTLSGRVATAAGEPLPGAWVVSTWSTLGSGPHLYGTAQAGSDGTFEVQVQKGASSRLFVSGPGCPLSSFDAPPQPSDGGGDPPPLADFRCSDQPAALEVNLVDQQGKPVPNATVLLRREGGVIPQGVLALHLQLLGLQMESDGGGHLLIAGLSPGAYDLYLGGMSSEATIAAGLEQGHLAAASLAPLSTTELMITLAPAH